MVIPELTADALLLRRPSLAGLGRPDASGGHTLRTYQAGDAPPWAELLTAAFPDHPWDLQGLHKEFLDASIWQPERIRFACAGASLVACTAAWHREWCGPHTGMIHWVATHPEHLRRGLGRAVVLAALGWMREFGYRDAALVTQVHRLPAIRLYLALGFRPDLEATDDMPQRWAGVEAAMRSAQGQAL